MLDLKNVLALDSGKRLIGRLAGCAAPGHTTLVAGSFELSAYNEGLRAAACVLANAVREIDPRLLAECEIAVREFEKSFEDEEREGYDE
jgi:hypothetical protein